MLTVTLRPKTFDEVVGQPLATSLLRCIAKDPDRSPQVLLLHGPTGTGKTSCVRILAKALNCREGADDACGTCEICDDHAPTSSFYQEFDSSLVGNKEDIEGIQEDFFIATRSAERRVVVFDEFQVASRAAQSSLLKALEHLPKGVLVAFCTTDVEKILPTIRGRSMDLAFHRAPREAMEELLTRVSESQGLVIEGDVREVILATAQGHARECLMLVDVLKTLGSPEEFLKHIRSPEQTLIKLLISIRAGDKSRTKIYLKKCLSFSLATLRETYHRVLKSSLRVYATGEAHPFFPQQYGLMVEMFKGDLIKLLGFSMTEWAIHCFRDDQTAQAFFWSAYLTFGKAKKQNQASTRNRFSKNR